MGLQLPGELVSLLGMLGYNWPQGDEEKLLEVGQSWTNFPSRFGDPVTQAHDHAQQVWTENRGQGIDAFQQAWLGDESPVVNLQNSSTAAGMIGVGMMVCAGIVLVLKINVIIQLVQLAIEIASAIAEAVVTAGASLAE